MQLRRRAISPLTPVIFDPTFERELIRTWSDGAPDPADALLIRSHIETYLSERPKNPAIICTAQLRPLLADFVIRSGFNIEVFAYADLPSELDIRPAAVIASVLRVA
jgi:hypothetical protein